MSLRWVYHKTEEPKIIKDEEFEKHETEGWRDTPAAFLDVKKVFNVDPEDKLSVQLVGQAVEGMAKMLNQEINVDTCDDRSDLLDYADKRFNLNFSGYKKIETIRRKIKERLDDSQSE